MTNGGVNVYLFKMRKLNSWVKWQRIDNKVASSFTFTSEWRDFVGNWKLSRWQRDEYIIVIQRNLCFFLSRISIGMSRAKTKLMLCTNLFVCRTRAKKH